MDEFLEAQTAKKAPGVTGWWDRTLPMLDDQRRASLLDAAVNRNISHSTIATVLTKWGFPVSAQQVGHWRRTHVG